MYAQDTPMFSLGPKESYGTYKLYEGNVLDVYSQWDSPDIIISDGAYGVSGFPGDPDNTDGLPEWYSQHLQQWNNKVKPSTVLFFWNTEVGWATMHPHLLDAGWVYVQLVIWDKGISHVAGNVNGRTTRSFPVVTEVCGIYTRPMTIPESDNISAQVWLRNEWERTGLPWKQANDACGVKDAATRKYLAKDNVWYPPPPDIFKKLYDYANCYGQEKGRPYFKLEGDDPAVAWRRLRYQWNHVHGLTNVWTVPSLRGAERIKSIDGKNVHLNQKPIKLMSRCVESVGNVGDIVWEPFGGMGSAAAAAVVANRNVFVAEHNPLFSIQTKHRLDSITAGENL